MSRETGNMMKNRTKTQHKMCWTNTNNVNRNEFSYIQLEVKTNRTSFLYNLDCTLRYIYIDMKKKANIS